MAHLEQDDLDDLDDVLNQFASQPAPPTSAAAIPTSPLTSPPPPPPPPSATVPTFTGRPRTNTRVDGPPIPIPGNGLPPLGEGDEDPNALAADFATELAKGMESLMREIAAGQATSGEGDDADADADPEGDAARFKAAWEAMLVQEMDASAASTSTDPGVPTAADGDFQAKIRAAMNKVNEGESTLQSDSASGSAPAPDSLEALLAQLNGLGGPDLPADEAELAGFLENMMGELMSKEVLYEPLTELAEKVPISSSLPSTLLLPSFVLTRPTTQFPPYLASHNPTTTPPLSPDDRTRYESQLARVRDILAIFDAPNFSDTDKDARERVVALMAEMQSFGSPPPELMGPLPPGLGALGSEEGCTIA
ncbi:Pex19 protein family-domain-containing protein [Mycena olivaceomarginata]|nr:Pex19 protein family-domain-containing protein [Mycena olivaceomarginata]